MRRLPERRRRTMILLYLSIPCMVLAVALAVVPLVWAMSADHRRRNESSPAPVTAGLPTPQDGSIAQAA